MLTWKRGDLEPCCRPVDVEVWSSGALVACGRRGGVRQARRRGSREVWSPEVLEANCWSVDVDVWRYGVLEACCRCADVEAWSRAAIVARSIECSSSGGAL